MCLTLETTKGIIHFNKESLDKKREKINTLITRKIRTSKSDVAPNFNEFQDLLKERDWI